MPRITVLLLLSLVVIALAAGPAPASNPGTITVKGAPHALLGPGVSPGDEAPSFSALDAKFQPVSLKSFRGHPVLISAVPSLDTKVCTLQTERFNQALADLPGDMVVLTVSMDMPTAQARFCGAHDITKMAVLSDSARREFGQNYGVLIPDRGQLARSVFVIDAKGIVRYAQVVPEMSQEPDYDAALAALKKVTGPGAAE